MNIPTTTPTARTIALLAQADREEPGKLAKVQAVGARVLQFADPDDYALVYTAGPRPKALIVNWQGHRDPVTGGGWPADGVGRWIPHLRAMHGKGLTLAVASLQTFDEAGVYLTTTLVQQRIALLASMLRLRDTGTALIYHGFSKGGTIAYRLAFDNLPEMAGVIADSVAYAPTLADNAPIEAATGLPLVDRRVVMTSGAGDTGKGSSPDAMRTSLEVVTVMGAATLLLTGGVGAPTDHGFFLGNNNTAQVEQAVRFLLGVQ
jgi:hypothetical protein